MRKIILALYSLLLFFTAVFSYAFIDSNLIYLKGLFTDFAFVHRQITTVIYISVIFLFFIFYFLFLSLVREGKLNQKQFKFIIIITSGILLFSYPAMLSYDIFNYIATAKVTFFHHENPYLIMPIEFIGDPLLLFTHAANKIALYGPIWIILSAIPYLLSFGKFVLILLNFKLFILGFYLATIALIWKISRNLLSVALFALNPLIIIETLVSGHNDIAMMFLALLAFYFLIKKKLFSSFIFLVLSIFIKYSTLFLVPVFAYTLFKAWRKEALNWNKIFYLSSLSMFTIFLLSPIREEIYSWYAIWFLTFIALMPQKKIIFYFSFSLSFGLLLRYIPYMLMGTYFDPTPILKTILTFAPSFFLLIYLFLTQRKSLFRDLFVIN
ncbi:MAG: hypothetical protein ABH816_02345 [Candidatus Levyibacteriota bacterium]